MSRLSHGLLPKILCIDFFLSGCFCLGLGAVNLYWLSSPILLKGLVQNQLMTAVGMFYLLMGWVVIGYYYIWRKPPTLNPHLVAPPEFGHKERQNLNDCRRLIVEAAEKLGLEKLDGEIPQIKSMFVIVNYDPDKPQISGFMGKPVFDLGVGGDNLLIEKKSDFTLTGGNRLECQVQKKSETVTGQRDYLYFLQQDNFRRLVRCLLVEGGYGNEYH